MVNMVNLVNGSIRLRRVRAEDFMFGCRRVGEMRFERGFLA